LKKKNATIDTDRQRERDAPSLDNMGVTFDATIKDEDVRCSIPASESNMTTL